MVAMLKAISGLFKPVSGIKDRTITLQTINAALYDAYLDDRAPFSVQSSEALYKTPGLAIYLSQVEDIARASPETWRFRLKSMECRSRRLSHLFTIDADISELPLEGFQCLWAEDLTAMMERRKPLIGSLTLPLDFYSIEIQHLALPFFRNGQITNIVGAFSADEMSLRAIRRSKKLKLEAVRRSLRQRALELPKAKRLEGAGAYGRKFWRSMSDGFDLAKDGAFEINTLARADTEGEAFGGSNSIAISARRN
jgi:hypothetical protein